MKIVIATDSFKGCMTSEEAGSIIAGAFREHLADAEITVIPVADGGEGTTDAILRATGGKLVNTTVTGPLGDPVEALFGLIAGGRTAVMEMASASGIEHVSPDDLDPMKTTTFGTGELILAALDAGAREIIIGVGGSATVDGGMGMAQALGYGLITTDGTDCGWGGAALRTLDTIVSVGMVPALAHCSVRVACDVTSPLLGPRGAARVFGPQKGATPEAVEQLERGLGHLAKVWRREGLLESVDLPGDGAAGGLGAGLRAFCRAELRPGADLVSEMIGFDGLIGGADLLVTGEGRTDEQTADGKLPSVLAKKAKMAGVRTTLISGTILGDLGSLENRFDAMYATVDANVGPEEAVRRGRENLARKAGEAAGRLADTTST